MKISLTHSAMAALLLGISSCGETSTPSTNTSTAKQSKKTKPNVILIYCDDLGYSDLSCYQSQYLKTPNIDKLANEGIRFTHGHTTSATSTPSRYALMTGEYPWKNPRAHVLRGNAPMLIDTTYETLPKLFAKAGYDTGIVGKWHLGLGNGNVNWNKTLYPNPNSLGFQYSYIMAATVDRVPAVYLENGLVQGLDPNDPLEVNYKHNYPGQPTGKENPELLEVKNSVGHDMTIINGIGRIGYMKGGKAACWKDDEMASNFYSQAENYIDSHKDHPFFLYYALHEPHVPRVPSKQFEGKSGMGPRGDVILEIDWLVGKLMAKLEHEGLADNTLVIFSSDNGPILDDGYYDMSSYRWKRKCPTGDLRGGKCSLLQGGTTVPLIFHWKGHIKPQTSEAMVSQIDFLASFAHFFGIEGLDTKDSENTWDTFMGKSNQGRKRLVLEGLGRLAYIEDHWSMIPPHKGPKIDDSFCNVETGYDTEYQLYDIAKDRGQRANLAHKHPHKLKELKSHFEEITHRKG